MSCDCKKCFDCGELKHLDKFTKDSSKKDGKNIYCIPCRAKRSAKWKEKTDYKEKRKVSSEDKLKNLQKNLQKKDRKKFSRIIGANIAHFDFLKKYFDLYFFILVCVLKNHNDMILKRRAWQKIYDKEKRPKQSPQLWAPNDILRRARKKSAILPSTNNLIIQQMVNNRVALDSYAKAGCYLANKLDLANKLPSSQKTKWSIDHLVPLSKGGSHHQDNLRVSKLSENIAKLDHSYDKYIHVQTRWAMNKESFENPLSPYFKNNS
jgi:5-methylcytosine-specific restriction endonuclease McrA